MKIEVKRILKNKLFWSVLLIGCLISISQYFMYVRPCVKYLTDYQNVPFGSLCPHTWYEKWIGGEYFTFQSYIYFLIIPIIAAVPCAITLSKDKITGYQYQLFTRGKKRNYYISKYVVSFISGGIAVLIPLLINLWLSITTLPSIIPDPTTGTSMITNIQMMSEFYFLNPNLYILIYLFVIFMYSGVFSVFVLIIGEITKNLFISILFPFMSYVFVYVMLNISGLQQYAPFCFLTPAQRAGFITETIIVFEFLGLFVVSGAIYCILAAKNQTIE